MIELLFLFLLILLVFIGVIGARWNLKFIEHKNRQYLNAIKSVKPTIKKHD